MMGAMPLYKTLYEAEGRYVMTTCYARDPGHLQEVLEQRGMGETRYEGPAQMLTPEMPSDLLAQGRFAAANHALMLTFATPGGAYVADVDVEIRRGAQVVLRGHCGGPLLLADLAPAGKYEVQATSKGRVQRKTVTIGAGKPARLSFVWPEG